MVPISYYILLSAAIFSIGLFGVLTRRNALMFLISIELMLNAANLNFVAFSTHLDLILGQVYSMFILTVAAAEAAIGLAIIVDRSNGSVILHDNQFSLVSMEAVSYDKNDIPESLAEIPTTKPGSRSISK